MTRLPPVGTRFPSRRALRAAFPGTTVRGISYLASSNHAVLISGSPSPNVGTYNYGDRWLVSPKSYEYFGEWHGCGDMELTRGNAALVARSPRLDLVVWEEEAYVYMGRFRLVEHYHRKAKSRYCGHPHSAIVFVLQK